MAIVKISMLPGIFPDKKLILVKTINTRQGIFEVKDGILAVKEAYQSSAINEYAGVEVTTTVKSQVEGVDDYVFKNTIFVKAVRPKKRN